MNLSLSMFKLPLAILLLLSNLKLCLASPREAIHDPRYISTAFANCAYAHAEFSRTSTTATELTTSLVANDTTTTRRTRSAKTFSTTTTASESGSTSVSDEHGSWGDWGSSPQTANSHVSGEDLPSPKTSGGRSHQVGTSDASGTNDSSSGDASPQQGGHAATHEKGSSWGFYRNSTTRDNTTSNDSWFGENDGVPALTEEDILFIISERALAYAGFPDSDGSTWPLNDSVVIKRQTTNGTNADYFGGENTLEKWKRLEMDSWLEKYVADVDIPGQPGKKLANSTNFFHDFWLSTGEENVVVCDSLLESCNVAGVSDDTRFSYINRTDAYRAQYVRQVIKVWQSSNKQAYDIFSRAVSDSQLNILAAHTVLVQGTPPPQTNIFEVLVPALALVAAFVPVLAPVAGVMAGVYAFAQAVTKREDTMEGVVWAKSQLNHTDYFETLQVRQDGQQTTDTINDLLQRVAKLEVPPKTWLDQANNLATVVSKAGDAAAKTYIAFKGLNPQLPASSISSWDVFDSRVLQTLQLFPKSILTSFEQNIKTYWAQQTTNAAGTTILSSGMRPFLLGGRWSLASANKENVSDSATKVKKYLDAVIFMQYVQQQAFYYWIQDFPTSSACTKARQDAISDGWLASNGWYNCKRLDSGQYQLQYTRKPTTARGFADVSQNGRYYPGGDVVALEHIPNSDRGCYVQERSGSILRRTGFDQVTAGLNKWNDGVLSTLGYGFKLDEVFAASQSCQTAMGDPFIPNKAPRNAFYPPMRLKDNTQGGGESEILSGTLPPCLFNLPIFEVGRSDLNNWCKNHMGEMRGSPGWYQGNEACGDELEWWAIQSDTKLCGSNQGDYAPTRDSRPGCSLHERGVVSVSCPRWSDN